MDADNPLATALRPLLDLQRARAEIVEPWDSYWFHRPQRSFPPRAIRDVADYDGGERLSLAITQTDLPAAKQKALVRDWCALLPTFSNVRTLWFHSRVTQEMFAAACAIPALRGLYVKWSAITSLAPIAGLTQLSHFHLGGAPSASGLDALAQLPALIDLEIANVRAAGDLSFLTALPQLQSLSLTGERNSLKDLTITSLAPLTALQQLQRLVLSCVNVVDGSLAPLAALSRLRWLFLPNSFEMAEFATLARLRPDLHCDSFVADHGPHSGLTCKKCRQKSLYLLTGRRKPWLCEHCEGERLARHRAEFEALRQGG